jgi:hypothetical protein
MELQKKQKRNQKRKLCKKLRTMKLPIPEAYQSRGRKVNKAARRKRQHWSSDLWNTTRYRYDGTVKNPPHVGLVRL